MSSSDTGRYDQAIRALEGWHDVHDAALLNGKDESEAVDTADEWARLAGPAYPRPLASLEDVLKDFYLGPMERQLRADYDRQLAQPDYHYDARTDTYTLRDGRRATRHGLQQALHEQAVTEQQRKVVEMMAKPQFIITNEPGAVYFSG